jgi:hypothetical protein
VPDIIIVGFRLVRGRLPLSAFLLPRHTKTHLSRNCDLWEPRERELDN